MNFVEGRYAKVLMEGLDTWDGPSEGTSWVVVYWIYRIVTTLSYFISSSNNNERVVTPYGACLQTWQSNVQGKETKLQEWYGFKLLVIVMIIQI